MGRVMIYIAGVVLAALLGIIGWQKLTINSCNEESAEWRAKALRHASEAQSLTEALKEQSQLVARWKDEAEASEARRLQALNEVRVSEKARQGRIQAVWRWGNDT